MACLAAFRGKDAGGGVEAGDVVGLRKGTNQDNFVTLRSSSHGV
jgi:hypothetical protein